MLNVLDADILFSASDYAETARAVIADVHNRGRIPVIVGGSGLYLKALLFGLSESPGRDDGLREELYAEADEEGLDALYERVLAVDPDYAAKIHHNDRVRIVRALEVYRLTGRPLSEHHDDHDSETSDFRIAGIALSVRREMLHARIADRVERMVASGLVEEVQSLLFDGVRRDSQPMQSIGYKEVLGLLDEAYDTQRMKKLIARNTRRFAKRQLVWFRKDAWLHWLDALTVSEQCDELMAALSGFLDGHAYKYGDDDERPISGT